MLNFSSSWPYIALVCIGTHNHPLPPECTPSGIRDKMQTMIQNIIASDDSVTPRSIVAGKSLKYSIFINVISTL